MSSLAKYEIEEIMKHRHLYREYLIDECKKMSKSLNSMKDADEISDIDAERMMKILKDMVKSIDEQIKEMEKS